VPFALFFSAQRFLTSSYPPVSTVFHSFAFSFNFSEAPSFYLSRALEAFRKKSLALSSMPLFFYWLESKQNSIPIVEQVSPTYYSPPGGLEICRTIRLREKFFSLFPPPTLSRSSIVLSLQLSLRSPRPYLIPPPPPPPTNFSLSSHL